jgi:hypothetical protein
MSPGLRSVLQPGARLRFELAMPRRLPIRYTARPASRWSTIESEHTPRWSWRDESRQRAEWSSRVGRRIAAAGSGRARYGHITSAGS